ncbi:GNAT family N-acetyltransferase [Anaeromicropila populeti]|uniref:N-acetylglutamate synthase, GNAT family n=1 Tax=Anaeromicropila populeti TaxID=37658 RepID=A0A1I6I9W9_9FIRM|nr:GNAT family N-acetyltransferase [Anaeromicropila populeti]SFR63565.1 N-acetylglutamate synthase, GNAT family [Anaeromicropila populeti]
MIIRKATSADVNSLVFMRIEYLKETLGRMDEKDIEALKKQLQLYFKTHINVDFTAYVAEQDRAVVATGFMIVNEKPASPLFMTGKTGTVYNVYTRPQYQKKGLATSIMNQIIQEAKKKHISYIELSATDAGKPLYDKLGFMEKISAYTDMKLVLER